MSASPPLPPPPPPPPPMPFDQLPRVTIPSPVRTNLINSSSYYSLDVCKWASENYQLQEACAKCRLCLHEPPFKHKYKHFEPIIQVGPTCGLVAVSMLINGEVSPDEILSIVKMKGFSCNGEMFSCKDMLKLSEQVFSLADVHGIKCRLKVGGLCSDDTVQQLIEGALMLVPYDADANHFPCLRHGHTAHWALICGVIIIKDLENGPTSDDNNVYVLARHGKSTYVSAWNLYELSKSNRNLWEFSPKKGGDLLTYVLPQGGVGGDDGLRNQFLVFEGF